MKIILKIPALTRWFEGSEGFLQNCIISNVPSFHRIERFFSVRLSPAISHEDLKARLWTFYLVHSQEKQDKQETKLTITNNKKRNIGLKGNIRFYLVHCPAPTQDQLFLTHS